MSCRALGLLLLAVIEILATLSLRNEASASSSRAMVALRQRDQARLQLAELEVAYADRSAPMALTARRRVATSSPPLFSQL